MLNDHERRIVSLEEGQAEIKGQMNTLSEQVTAGNTKAEKDNTYLREQNDKMFRTLIEINTRSQDRKHELKLLDKQNFWKLTLGIGGSAGVLYTIAQALIEYLSR
ncbi:hypothetical protein SAMN05421503_2465 [Terribacillus aidingensis]|uniref:Haemolysin XhlA n=1 Tax=Terribacillus aidingensis TaxID=586416 RepID=A0A285P027_9BACI|nr:hypothetical protein [Terribacillus aidingensis]SNZ14543.1 hypothetical protein SAMN05421503_2465 [Terribacillus aidingensis]